MMDYKLLFSQKNLIESLSEKDLVQDKSYLEVIKAFSRLTYQSIYVIDYEKRAFEYVSENPLFLSGLTPKEVLNLGYEFYQKYVPEEDFKMLIDINNAGFDFYEKIPIEEKKDYIISYDFHLKSASKKTILINHKLTPVFLTESGKIWKAVCVVSLSTNPSSGNVMIGKQNSHSVWDLNFLSNQWIKRHKTNLSEREIEILGLYSRGLSISEIAETLFVSVDTVKFHRRKLFDKLNVNSINEALATAVGNKLL
ncbi:MAG: helix-turn-helix transcriptional regulator [Chryseobacterium sp. 36-9]|nr:MAG: helix-turn-helix transcriptional regulator [Chryseobacterium sp. 36-9]